MKHVFWVYRNKVAGRPGPVAAPWSLPELKQGGFDRILSVASDLFPHSAASASGISRTCIPLPDVAPPDAETVAICRANLRATLVVLERSVERGHQVLVHCAAGKDRTGLVLAHYVAKTENVGAAEAIRILRATRPEALSAEGWEEMALELIDDNDTNQ